MIERVERKQHEKTGITGPGQQPGGIKSSRYLWRRCRIHRRRGLGLRAKAKNFSMEDMKEGIAFAHVHGVKVYVTANILAHNQDSCGCARLLCRIKRDRAGRAHHLRSGRVPHRHGGLPGKSSGISVLRQTIRTTERISSGTSRAQSAL